MTKTPAPSPPSFCRRLSDLDLVQPDCGIHLHTLPTNGNLNVPPSNSFTSHLNTSLEEDEELIAMENENLRLQVEVQKAGEKQKRLAKLKEENRKLRDFLNGSAGDAPPAASSKPQKRLQDHRKEDLENVSTDDLKTLLHNFEQEKRESAKDVERCQILAKIRDTDACAPSEGLESSNKGATSTNQAFSAENVDNFLVDEGKGMRQGGKKSGANQKWDTSVYKTEPYPHQYIGSYIHQFDSNHIEWNKDNIPMPLFVSGFINILQKDLNLPASSFADPAVATKVRIIRDRKLQFLCDLMYLSHSANSWGVARQMANQKFLEQELSETMTWDDYKSSTDFLFLMHQTSTSNNSKSTKPPPSKPKGSQNRSGKEMPSYICKRWNAGSCNEATDHVTNDIIWRHSCFSCSKKGFVKLHKETDSSCPSQ
jgi:hypothetical protein